jgi:methylmalonyl-CoA epimerase
MIPELSECALDHIAIATNSITDTVKIYSDLGLNFNPELEVVESQGVTTAFAPLNSNGSGDAQLELLEPFGESGPIHTYLEKKGPGLHHLCFKVSDVKMKSEQLKSKGYIMLNDEPVQGAHNCIVNFIHPKSTGGVLIEISQKNTKES